MIEEHELIRIKKTKFVEMYYDLEDRELHCVVFNAVGTATGLIIPINKIPQIQRGLIAVMQRFYRRKK